MNDVSGLAAARLLIGDEVHNLGRESFVSNPPAFFEHRLALSATPVRQYDPDGTEAVFDFFGEVVYKFTLRDAIGRCLVEYDYYLHPVALTEMEMDLWKEITARIRQNAWRQTDNQPDEYLAKLFRDRRLLLETAEDKIETLSRLLDQENLNTLRHTLIYASDKEPRQLDAVNSLLNQKGVLFHQLTAEETADRRQTRQIIEAFQGGDIQVLTAKRVLDEGVNIPQISKAFILASTTVERQWIQRRGRLLRTCKETGKTHSVINDLLALPPSLDTTIDGDARALIRSELRRAQEFASLARNAGKADGPLPLIHKLVKAAFL
jgi:superfamily II DNA or RNA helicase